MSDARIVIVDPFSSGALLAETLRSQRVPIWAVESSTAIPLGMRSRFEPAHFAAVLVHDQDYERTLRSVASIQPTHVMAGFESGVELAEQLSDSLGLPTNDPQLRLARRDKYEMALAAQHAGLRTAHQLCVRSRVDVHTWNSGEARWPVIVKPTRSVASDHVARCHSLAEVMQAVDNIMNHLNVLGLPNEAALIQEFLDGDEYVVDTVSYNGHSRVTAVWRYERPRDTTEFIPYNAIRLVPYAGERQARLIDYASRLLTAVGIKHGPAHCELMWVDNEPVLMEVGARMSAGNNATLSARCGGISQLAETISVLINPDRFLTSLGEQPTLLSYAANVFLAPQVAGRLVRTQYVDQLEKLPTLDSMSIVKEAGTYVERVAGRITLISPDNSAIDRDIQTVRSLEKAGLFEVEATANGASQ